MAEELSEKAEALKRGEAEAESHAEAEPLEQKTKRSLPGHATARPHAYVHHITTRACACARHCGCAA